MLKLTARESILALLTLTAGLGGLTWWQGAPRMERWRSIDRDRAVLAGRREVAERLVDRRVEIETRLALLLRALPRYKGGEDVTAELLRTVESMAQQHSLTLTRRETEKERAASELRDLFETTITCSWEGPLEALVRFLYAAQSQGAMLDLSQLTANPARSRSGGLSGTFTIACAYTREGTGSSTAGTNSAVRASGPAPQRTP